MSEQYANPRGKGLESGKGGLPLRSREEQPCLVGCRSERPWPLKTRGRVDAGENPQSGQDSDVEGSGVVERVTSGCWSGRADGGAVEVAGDNALGWTSVACGEFTLSLLSSSSSRGTKGRAVFKMVRLDRARANGWNVVVQVLKATVRSTSAQDRW
ncbi:hypothetical protein VTJ49DRAFT_5357 [Mycothermus thermophilus]|uniref:Uncharacterized protein n=1 Tax=Humicola insolens TaxID=85995 RepID=A0ABR3VL21_HUMIN